MKYVLCAFAIALSFAVYPITLLVNSELVPIFSHIEIDFFNWYRMLLVGVIGIPFLFLFRGVSWGLWAYLILLFASTALSRFPETSIYGTPMHHEGLIALLGYLGIYAAAKRFGLFKELELSLNIVVYTTAFFAVLQLIYGNFLNFPLFKLIIPKLMIHAETFPIYGNMAGPNHLGLFCALFLPYAIVKKKHLQVILLMALLIGSQTRGAWLSAVITTALISRRYLIYLIVIGAILSIPMHDIVTWRIKRTAREVHYPIQDVDFGGRAYMWKMAIPALKDTILLGHGPSTFISYFPQFTERGAAAGFANLVIDRPHNIFINIWQNTGLLSLIILGLLVFLAIFFSVNPSLEMGVIGFLIAGIFTDSVLCVTPYFLIFLGGLSNEHNEAR